MARSVVIVGAGPAGMSAAIAAHERGARVTVGRSRATGWADLSPGAPGAERRRL